MGATVVIRRLLILATLIVAVVSSLEAQGKLRLRTPASGGGSEGVLSEANFDFTCATYCGTAVLPFTFSDGSYPSSSQFFSFGGYLGNEGLAEIEIAGVPQFITTCDAIVNGRAFATATLNVQGEPCRFVCATFSQTPPFPECDEEGLYGDPFDGKQTGLDDGSMAGPPPIYYSGPHGLLVDGSNLYLTYEASPYTNTGGCPSCVGVNPSSMMRISIDSTSQMTGQASYKFEGVDFKSRAGSIMPIPTELQAQFGGKTHLMTNNGYTSGQASDPNVAAWALNLPTGAHLTEVAASAFTKVMGGGDFTACRNSSSRINRPTWLPDIFFNYNDDPVLCSPGSAAWGTGGTGSIQVRQLFDISSACVMPYVNGKTGMVCFDLWTLSGTDYINATSGNNGSTTGMSVYSVADLAAAYAGSIAPTAVQINNSWPTTFPLFDYGDIPFTPNTATAATMQGIAATDMYRLEFPGGLPSWMADGVKFSVYGNSTFNGGYSVPTGGVIDSDTVEVCLGQSGTPPCTAQADIPADIPAESTITISQFLGSGMYYGRVAGASFKRTNSACGGQSNMLAFIWDRVNPLNANEIYRYLTCIKVVE